MPPPRARLHTRTGKLKNINKSNDNSPRSRVNAAPVVLAASTPANASASVGNDSPNASAALSDTNAQQFELELCWCIQTLEKSLESPSITPKAGNWFVHPLRRPFGSLALHLQPKTRRRQSSCWRAPISRWWKSGKSWRHPSAITGQKCRKRNADWA